LLRHHPEVPVDIRHKKATYKRKRQYLQANGGKSAKRAPEARLWS
jgi:hypothetical protein